jgi:hypothetical protein
MGASLESCDAVGGQPEVQLCHGDGADPGIRIGDLMFGEDKEEEEMCITLLLCLALLFLLVLLCIPPGITGQPRTLPRSSRFLQPQHRFAPRAMNQEGSKNPA